MGQSKVTLSYRTKRRQLEVLMFFSNSKYDQELRADHLIWSQGIPPALPVTRPAVTVAAIDLTAKHQLAALARTLISYTVMLQIIRLCIFACTTHKT